MQVTFHHTPHNIKREKVLTEKVTTYAKKITRIAKTHTYKVPEASLGIAADDLYQDEIKKLLKPFLGVRHVVLVGIGGSSLGTEAVYQALAFTTGPSLLVLDTINPETLLRFEALCDMVAKPHDIAVVVVSKSGATTETLANASSVFTICEKSFGPDYYKRIICISDPDTPFLKSAKKKKMTTITMPECIGGRYSVFTAVGIVPLTLLKIDVASLREGAHAVFQKEHMQRVVKSAVSLAYAAEAGVHTVNFFTFNERLKLVGYWYRQLLGESIGKTMTTKGTSFQHQLLPIVSTGVDLHSMAQLYLSKYPGMYTHFVTFSESSKARVALHHWLIAHLPFLGGKKHTEIQEAIRDGVLKAYDDQKLPYKHTELPKCTAYEVGLLLASLMMETMCLAQALNVDAFDQPSVELYKKHTREALGAL